MMGPIAPGPRGAASNGLDEEAPGRREEGAAAILVTSADELVRLATGMIEIANQLFASANELRAAGAVLQRLGEKLEADGAPDGPVARHWWSAAFGRARGRS